MLVDTLMPPGLAAPIVAALDGAGQLALVLDVGPRGLRPVWANGSFGRLGPEGDAMAVAAAMLAERSNHGAMDRAAAVLVAGTGAAREEVFLPVPGGPFRRLGVQFLPIVADGRLMLLMIGRDITEQFRREQTSAATQWLLAQVFRHVDAAAVIVGEDGRIAMANPRLGALRGEAPEAMTGMRASELLHPDDRAGMVERWSRQVADGRPYDVQVRVKAADGGWRRMRVHAVAVERGDRQRYQIATLLPDDALPPPILVAGKLRLIGLDQVKASLGPRWPALAERAMATAEHVIRRRLEPSESVARTEDQGFVVCFNAGSEEELTFRAAALAREIGRKLLGEAEEPALAQVSAQIDPTPLPPAEADAGASAISDAVERRLAALRDAQLAMAREALGAAVAAGATEFATVLGGRGERLPLALLDLDRATRMRIVTAQAVLPPAETARLDPAALRLGLATAALPAATGRVLLPVEFAVLTPRETLDRTLATLRGLIPRNTAVPLVVELPAGLGRPRLAELLRGLRTVAPAVAIELEEPEELPFDPALGLVAYAVADAARLLELARRRAPLLRLLLSRLAPAHVRLIARGTVGPGDVAELVAAGIAWHLPQS